MIDRDQRAEVWEKARMIGTVHRPGTDAGKVQMPYIPTPPSTRSRSSVATTFTTGWSGNVSHDPRRAG